MAKKQKILLVFSDEPRGGERREIEKKQKKFTQHHLQIIRARDESPKRKSYPFLLLKTFSLLLLVFPKAPRPHNNYSIGQNKLSLK